MKVFVHKYSRMARGKLSRVKQHYRVMRPKQYNSLKHMDNFIVEGKYDGSRNLMYYKDGSFKLINRRDIDTTNRFPELEGIKLRAKEAVLDTEVIVPDYNSPYGDFRKLSTRDKAMVDKEEILRRSKKIPAKLIAFDILRKDGKDLTQKSLLERKKVLNEVIPDTSKKIQEIEYSTDMKKIEGKIKKGKGEGIVVKDLDSPYEQKESNSWQKKKIFGMNDISVLGFTQGTGKRKGLFGALIMGVKSGDKWKYVGKVGTGFTDAELKRLYDKMKRLKTNEKHFDIKNVTYIKPSIVARVNYMKKTEAGRYREPRYEGERTDILASETHI